MENQTLSTRARATLAHDTAGRPAIQPPIRRTPRQYQALSSDPAASFQGKPSGGMAAQIRQQVNQRPWLAFGLALVAGYTLANLTSDDDMADTYQASGATARSYTAQMPGTSGAQHRDTPDRSYAPSPSTPSQHASSYPAASAGPTQPGLLSQLTSQFDDQFVEIKDTAVSTVIGLVRDTIKQNVPALHQELERVRAERGQPSSTNDTQTFSAPTDTFSSNRGDL